MCALQANEVVYFIYETNRGALDLREGEPVVNISLGYSIGGLATLLANPLCDKYG